MKTTNYESDSKAMKQLRVTVCYEDALNAVRRAVGAINQWNVPYNPDPDLFPNTANSNTAARDILQTLGIDPNVARDPQHWTPGL
jgi:hypothetical protein